jgi:hypothetical protein
VSISTQPPPEALVEWPQQRMSHPLDAAQRPPWAASIPPASRADVAAVLTGWCQRFWDAADVRSLVRHGWDADEATAVSYRLVACAVELSGLLMDLDELAAAA